MEKPTVKSVLIALLILVPAGLAAVGWVTFVGGFGVAQEKFGQKADVNNPLQANTMTPFYFTAVVTPLVLTLLVVEAVLIMVMKNCCRCVHAALVATTLILAFPLVAFNGYTMQLLALFYTARSLVDPSLRVYSDPDNAMFAGLLWETVFLAVSIVVTIIVLVVTPKKTSSCQSAAGSCNDTKVAFAKLQEKY